MKQLFLAITFCTATFLYGANPEIMPLKDIKPGMLGTGLTIFENNQIEQFDIEIIDIIHNFFPGRDIILVRLLGDKVKHTGVVHGMSGSPIYIDKKLIGALAYRMGDFMKDPIAGVTPIKEMLEIFDKEQVRDQEISPTKKQKSQFKDYLFSRHLEKFNLLNLLNFNNNSATVGIKPIEAPLVISGLSPTLYKKISNQFVNSNFMLSPGGKLAQTGLKGENELKPGSAAAGIIIAGDFDISATGTVTYRDDKRVLAFGHPFFNKGPVNIPLAAAKVITTFSSLYASSKFAVATDIVGNIRQDRSSGIMGVIGEIPPMIPINVRINSPLTAEKKFQFQLPNDRTMSTIMPVFLWITLLNALESSRLGGGDYALKLEGRIDLEQYPDVILDNFYAGGDAGYYDGSGLDIPEAAYEIVMSLSALWMNEFEFPNIRGIDLKFNARPGRKVAQVEKVFYDKQEIFPGDSLNMAIVVKPYQGKRIELSERVFIPENISADRVTIAIGGAEQITRWEYQAGIGRFIPKNITELVSLLNRRRKNSGIFIQIKIADNGAVLHGREFPTLPPSVLGIMKDRKTQKIYHSVTEKIVKEWEVPLDFEVRGGRKFELAVKHR